jgi:UDP:flavonoid glycosyltransferase YjiC (YdhE family)
MSLARAIISKGWANIGKDPPPSCHVIDNVPHDWLFTKVSAVCHHGGAGERNVATLSEIQADRTLQVRPAQV